MCEAHPYRPGPGRSRGSNGNKSQLADLAERDFPAREWSPRRTSRQHALAGLANPWGRPQPDDRAKYAHSSADPEGWLPAWARPTGEMLRGLTAVFRFQISQVTVEPACR